MQESLRVDAAIIGGGIIGLTLAYELKNKFPNFEIALFDKEPYLGEHSSGRNSGVLHAGLYYPHQSLKHLLCVEGNKLWGKMCSDLNIGTKKCGKFIFSISEDEDEKLNHLMLKATQNDVPVHWATSSEMQKLSQHVNCHKALSSPSTGILDVSEALAKLKYNLDSRGVHVFYSHFVKDISSSFDGFQITAGDFTLKSTLLFNCAGLNGIQLRKQLGFKELENFYVRGHYLATTQKLDYQTLYYPVPPDDLKGLGVHSTIDLHQKIKFGPNTEEVDHIDYTPPKDSLDLMKYQIVKYFKNIEIEKLFWDYSGCRSKIRFGVDKVTYPDFWIKSPIKNYVECLGIESPGLTASPAISKYIIDKLI